MDKKVLDISDFQTVGYKPLLSFKSWRVATLCYLDELYPPAIETMERHLKTDEVFVLLKGQTTLLIGGNAEMVEEIEPVPMQPLLAYNVRLGAWHGVVMSRDAVILLVEEADTEDDNSEYWTLTDAQKAVCLSAAMRLSDWQNLPLNH